MKNYLILLVAMLMLLSKVHGSTCQVFKWGSVKSSGTDELWVMKDEGDSTFINAQTWTDKTRACDSWKWNKPEEADKGTCGKEHPPKTWPPKFTYVDGAALDGDFWFATSNCYQSPWNQAECVKNVWKASTNSASRWDSNKDWAKEDYCAVDTWSPRKLEGLTCATNEECISNMVCLKKEGETIFKWTPKYSLKNGEIFTRSDRSVSQVSSSIFSDICDTGSEFSKEGVAERQCRKPFRSSSNDKGIDALAHKDVGSEWMVRVFEDEDFKNFDKESIITWPEVSRCGFNKDDRSYCPLNSGDDLIASVLAEVRKKDSSAIWHIDSGNEEGSIWAFTKELYDSNLGFKFLQYQEMMEDPQVAANTMNNDKCVAETIMSDFWQGNFDSGSYSRLIGIFSSLLFINFIF